MKEYQCTALGVGLQQQTKLTEQEHNCNATGEFQDVPLFGFVVESMYLIATCNHVEPTLRRNPISGGRGKFNKLSSRRTHAAGSRTLVTLRANKDELIWVAPSV